MGYDDVLPYAGNFGRYQSRIFAILLIAPIAAALHKMGGVFLGARVDFRCLLPYESSENATFHLTPNITNLTYLSSEEIGKWLQCETYDPNNADSYQAATGENITSTFSPMKCDSFVYDEKSGIHSVTTEWNLVCDDAWLKSLSESLFMLGNLPGVVFWGEVSDRYGRKTALVCASTIQLIAAVLVSVSPNFIVYVILRVILGATVSGLLLASYVAAVEMVAPQHRTIVGVIVSLLYTGGYMLSAGLAYFIRKWRYLQIAFTVPVMILLAFLWSVPESVRWLLTKGRVQEAKDILHKMSVENGTKLSPDTLDGLLSKNTDGKQTVGKTSVFDLLRYPNLRKKSLLLFFMWFTVSVTYYGLSWNAANLGGNEYVNFGLGAAVEVPAGLALIFTLDRWGRKINLFTGMLLSAISLLSTFFVPSGMTWLTITLTMLGKFAVTYAWGTMYVFTAELYPTTVRNVGVAACTAFANLGSTLAPQITYLFQISTYLPLVMLGSFAFVAGFLSLRLPETLNTKLPELIDDGEELKHFRNTDDTQQDIEKLKDTEST